MSRSDFLPMDNKLYSVKQAAGILNVSIKTLHRWEEKGILIPQRSPGNQRRYYPQDIKNLTALQNEKKSSAPPITTGPPIPPSDQTRPVHRIFLYLLIILLLLCTNYWLGKINTDLLRDQASQNQTEQKALTDKVNKLRGNAYTSNFSAKDLRVANNLSTQDLFVENQLSVGGSSDLQNLSVAGDTTLSNLTVTNGPVVLPSGSIDNSELVNSSLTYTAGSGLIGGGIVSLGGSASFNIGAGSGIGVQDDTISVLYGDDENTAVQGNQTIGITAGTNLAGGGSITLGAGGTLTLDTVSNPTFSTSVTTPLLNLTNSGFTLALESNTLTADQTLTLPDDTGEICISTGNCAGLGGTIAGAGTPNRVAKFNTSNTITDSSINDLGTGIAVTIDASGNVGIGTTTPTSFKLEIAGNIGPEADNTRNLGSAIRRWANIYGTNVNATTINATTVNATSFSGAITPTGFTQGSVVFAGVGGTLTQDNPNFFWDDTNNRLGIGTTAPAYELEVGNGAFGEGRVNLKGSQPFLRIQDTDVGFTTNWLLQAFNNRLRILNNDGATEVLSILTNGNIGIGVTNPAAALSVGTGSLFQVNSSGNLTFNQTAPTISIGNTGSLVFNDGTNTLCTITDTGTTGNLTCTGNITGASTGTAGYWTRAGTTLSPATTGDSVNITGNTTIGDASGDTLTANAATWTFANDTNFVLSGGVNGLSFDTTTLSIDATNDRVGIGTTAPNEQLEITGNLRLPATTSTTGIIKSGANNFIHSFGGNTNFFAGVSAGNLTLTSTNIVAIGNFAGNALTSGSNNALVGQSAGINLTTGHSNTFIGYNAGIGQTTQTRNTMIGSGAGQSATGIENIFIGVQAGLSTSVNSSFIAGSSTSPITNVYFGEGVNDSSPLGYTINGTGASGADTAGATLTLAGGIGTGTGAGGKLFFQTAAASGVSSSTANTLSTRMTIDSAGNVGIGDTTPAALLSVGNGDLFQVNSSGNMTFNQTAPTISIGNTGSLVFNDGTNTLCTITDAGTTGNLTCTGNITGASTGTAGYWSRSGTTLQPATSGDNVTTLGNVGVGTTAPDSKLTINGSGSTDTNIHFTNGSTGTTTSDGILVGIANTNQFYLFNYESAPTIFGTNAVERMRIDPSGNLGIGTTAPAGLLDISKALSATPSLVGKYLSISASTLTDSGTAGSGTLTNAVFNSIAAPTLAATNTLVTTTNAYTMYIAGAPIAGTNETITNKYALGINTGAAASKGLVVQGAASQTGNLVELQNSSGTVLSKFTSSGALDLTGLGNNATALLLPGGVISFAGGATISNPNADASLRFTAGSSGLIFTTTANMAVNTGQAGINLTNSGINGLAPTGYVVNFTGGDITHASSTALRVQNNSGTTTFNVNPHGSTTITNYAATDISLTLKGAAAQSADLLQLQDSGGLINGAFNSTGAQLTLGRLAASGTVTQGKLLLSDGTTDNFSGTLQTGTLTASRTYTLPDSTGTFCLNSGNCSGGGGAGYIINGTSQQSPGNFNILSAAAGSIGGQIQGAASATQPVLLVKGGATPGSGGDLLQLQNSSSTVLDAFTATGKLGVGVGTPGGVLTVQGFGSGSDNLLQVDQQAGVTRFSVGPFGVVNAGGNAGGNFNIVNITGTTSTALVVRAIASQTADLQAWQNSGGTNLARIDANGVLIGANGSGTNIAGSALTIAGGQGTGTGVGGNILFQYAAAGSTGSSLNTLATACRISGTNGSLSCPGTGSNSERFGAGSLAAGTGSVAIGNGANAAFGSDVAIGLNASTAGCASNPTCIAIGANTTVGGISDTVIGVAATISGLRSTVIGSSATGASESIAIGSSTVANDNSIVFGHLTTSAGFSNSIVMGRRATSTASNQFVAGSSLAAMSNVYFGLGATSTAPTAYTINGTAGSGTDIAGGGLQLAGGAATGNAVGGNINFQTSDAGSTGATLQSLTTKMTILASGNVGIGTTAPIYKFDFNGGATNAIFNLRNNLANDTSLQFYDNTNGPDFLLYRPANTRDLRFYSYEKAADIMTLLSATGNVGIGDITPDARLDVEPTGAVTTTSYAQQINNLQTNATTDAIDKYGLYISSTGTFTGSAGTATNNYGLFVATPTGGDNNYAAVFQGGNVGIGTTAPSSQLAIHGYTGIYVTSDFASTVNNPGSVAASGPVLNARGLGFATDGTLLSAGYQPTAGIGISINRAAPALALKNSGGPSLLIESGNVGIGTTAPTYRLSTLNSVSTAGSAVAAITNTNTTDSANTVTLRLNTGATSTTTNARFITFYAGCTTENCAGTAVGNISINNGNVAYNTGGADFAERVSVPEPTEAGDVIGADSTGNRKSLTGDRIIGVISDSAGFIGNDKEGLDKATNPVVGLLGQIRTKVATESGAIKKGDFLSLSATPGVAKKATSGGEVLGTALEDFSGTGVGKIAVLVRPGWYMPDVAMTDQGQISSADESPELGLPLVAAPTNNTPDSPALSKTEEFNPEEFDQRIASSSAYLELKAKTDDLNSKFLTLNSKIASLEASLDLFASNPTSAASTSAELGLSDIDADSLTLSETLNVGGRTTLSDVGVTGKITAGMLTINGLDSSAGSGQVGFASINTTSGPLKLQSDGFNGIDILNGKIVIESDGNMKVHGVITVKKINVEEAPLDTNGSNGPSVAGASIGGGTIEAGQTEVVIKTKTITEKSRVFTSPTAEIDVPLVVIKKIAEDSFTIKISSPQSNDVDFDWWVIN